MGLAVDDERTGAADAFATIVVKRDRVFAFRGQLFVDHVEHLEERHVRVELRRLISLKPTGTLRAFLAPDLESHFHRQFRFMGRFDLRCTTQITYSSASTS